MKLKTEDIAKVCHEANKALCESTGDFSQAAWAQAPAWQRGSAVASVQHKVDNPDATPEDSHISWLAMKDAEGWTYGKVKDETHKRHPCIMPYEDLPEGQKIKAHLFLAICKSLIPMLGKPVPIAEEESPIKPEDEKVDMNEADKDAMSMDSGSRNKGVDTKKDSPPKKKASPKKKEKTLPSGAPMPKVKEDKETE